MLGFGQGYSLSGYKTQLNDLWLYNASSNSWSYLLGENTSLELGAYGMKNVSDFVSVPPERQ